MRRPSLASLYRVVGPKTYHIHRYPTTADRQQVHNVIRLIQTRIV